MFELDGKNNVLYVLYVSLLLGLLSACMAPLVAQPLPSPTPEVLVPRTTVVAPSPTPGRTDEGGANGREQHNADAPTALPVNPVAVADLIAVDLSGVAQDLTAQVIDAVPPSEDAPWWAAMPEYTLLTLQGTRSPSTR